MRLIYFLLLCFVSQSFLISQAIVTKKNAPKSTLKIFTIEEKKVAGAEAAVPATTGFVPYLAVDFNFQNLDYVQTFDTKGQRRLLGPAMPVTGKNTINQKSSQLTIRGKPVSWARVKASYTKYTYSRDVSDFIQFLDTHNLVGNLSSGFSSALSGFYDNTVSFGISFFPHRDWELALSRSSSKVIYDESVSTTDKLVGYWDFRESWRLGLGQSVTKSNGPGSEASTYSIVSVDYDF